MERDLQAFLQVTHRGFSILVAASAAGQDHLGGGVAAQLVFDRLHDVLIADSRGGLDSGCGQCRHGVDQVVLSALPAGPEV